MLLVTICQPLHWSQTSLLHSFLVFTARLRLQTCALPNQQHPEPDVAPMTTVCFWGDLAWRAGTGHASSCVNCPLTDYFLNSVMADLKSF